MRWAEYDARSSRLAATLEALGIAAGERVAVLLPDGPGVHAALVGCEKAGVVAVGIGPRAGYKELEHLLRKTGCGGPAHSRPGTRTARWPTSWRDCGAPAPPLRHHLVAPDGARELEGPVDVDGAPAPVPDLAAAGPVSAPRPGRRLPAQLHLGHHGHAEGRDPRPARWFAFHDLAVARPATSRIATSS